MMKDGKVACSDAATFDIGKIFWLEPTIYNRDVTPLEGFEIERRPLSNVDSFLI